MTTPSPFAPRYSQRIERPIDPLEDKIAEMLWTIFETEDLAAALKGCDTWRQHSAPGFSHHVEDENGALVE